MTLDPAHHIYNIQFTENVFQWNLFISKFSSVAPAPSPIKATPTTIAGDPDGGSTASVSNADDVMMTSSSQNKELLYNHSILPKKDQPEGKITAIIAMMRVNLKMAITATAVTSTIRKN